MIGKPIAVHRLVLLLLVLIPVWGRAAGAASLLNGSILTGDGLQITVTGCTDTINSSASACSAASHLEIIYDGVATQGSVTGAEFTIMGDGSRVVNGTACGTCIYSAATGPSAGTYDLQVTLSIVKTSTHAHISSAALGVTGTTSVSGDLSDIAGSEAFTFTGGSASIGATHPPSSGATGWNTTSFTSQTTLSVSQNLMISPSAAAAGTTLVLSNVAMIFAPAPEPASVAVFLVALVGLAAVRRGTPRRTVTGWRFR